MPRGYSDFKLNPGNYGQFSGDNSELAVRLGSPDIFERRGRVIWFDDMNNGLSKYIVVGGATTVHEAMPLQGFGNGIVFRLTPAAGPADYPILIWGVPMITPTKLGVEFLWREYTIGVTTPSWLSFRMTYYDGFYYYNMSTYLNTITRRIYLTTNTPPPSHTYIVFEPPYPMDNQITNPSFHYFKVVYNLFDITFDRMVFNQLVANLSGLGVEAVVSLTRPSCMFILTVQPNTAANPIDFCNLIVTIDEP